MNNNKHNDDQDDAHLRPEANEFQDQPPGPDMPEQEAPADQSEATIAALQSELDQAKDQMLRALADTENTRKRLLREREDIRKYAVADFARDLLGFSDNFRRALESIPPELKEADERVRAVLEGIEAMEKELLRSFDKHGIKKMEPMDEPFNANYHEVMFEAPVPGKAAGTIIQLIEPGYLLHDRLLRPARVGVAKGDPGDSAPGKPGGHIDTEA